MEFIEQLLNEGLLKKDKPDIEKAKRSLKTAKIFIDKAEQIFNLKIFDLSLIQSYSSMSHSSRALLFKDGFKERSHYAIYIYIKERYKNKIPLKFINELNSLRMERHDFLYSIEKRNEIDEIEAESALQTAKEFIKIIKGILNENTRKNN